MTNDAGAFIGSPDRLSGDGVLADDIGLITVTLLVSVIAWEVLRRARRQSRRTAARPDSHDGAP